MRKLTKLRIDEISSVPRGANPGARVLVRKQDAELDSANIPPASSRKKPPKPKTIWEHQEMAQAGSWQEEDQPKMSKLLRKMYRAYAKAKAKNPPAAPPPVDSAELGRQIGKAIGEGQSFEVAATAAYRKSRAAPGPAVADDVADDPFAKMMKAAQDLSGENGETPESNFARIYADPRNRDIVAADKRNHFTRTSKSALPLPPSTKPIHGDEITKRVAKLMKRDGLDFERAATQALRGTAA